MFVVLLFSTSFSLTPSCQNADCDSRIRSATSFAKGDQISITAEINGYDNVTLRTKYVRFYPKVDKTALLQIPDTQCSLLKLQNSTIRLYIGNKTTKTWNYRAPASALIPQFYSAFVSLSTGTVGAFGWDTSFDNNTCRTISNKLPYLCADSKPITDPCNSSQIKIFLAFVGTDKNKVPLESAQYMPSTFLRFGLSGIFENAEELFTKVKGWIY